MSKRNPPFFDRFNRAMPIVGIPFFVYQAYKRLQDAKQAEQQLVIDGIYNELTKEHQLLANERKLLVVSAISIFITWVICISSFSNIIYAPYLFAGTIFITMIIDISSEKLCKKIIEAQ